jgi:hypothetical protein
MFRVRHLQDGTHAACGYDPARGYYVELTWNGVTTEYDLASSAYDDDRPLGGALLFLSGHGFLGNVPEALQWSGEQEPMPVEVRKVRRVARAFQEEAGE